MIHQPTPQKTHLLNIAVGMLLIFNCIQLYGIVSHTTPHTESVELQRHDLRNEIVQINIFNGCAIDGVGNTMMNFCRSKGYDVVEVGNYTFSNVEETLVVDRSGKIENAKMLAEDIGILGKNIIQQINKECMVTVSIIIGKDYKKLQPWKQYNSL